MIKIIISLHHYTYFLDMFPSLPFSHLSLPDFSCSPPIYPDSAQCVNAVPRAPRHASATGSQASVRVALVPLGPDVMAASRGTGGSPTASNANATGWPRSVTRGRVLASTAGTMQLGTTVRGEGRERVTGFKAVSQPS